MTKWILLFLTAVQMIGFAAHAKTIVSSESFNKLIETATIEQKNTAHVLWDHERIKDYIRRKRTLQNTKTMFAETKDSASDQQLLIQKLSEN